MSVELVVIALIMWATVKDSADSESRRNSTSQGRSLAELHPSIANFSLSVSWLHLSIILTLIAQRAVSLSL